MQSFKYLTEVAPDVLLLSHKLTPEVRAMFASMASRLPDGGIKKRYSEIVRAVAASIYNEKRDALFAEWEASGLDKDVMPEYITWDEIDQEFNGWLDLAENRLTAYPLHPAVQRFFDQFVGQYGHSSIQEMTGDPAIYVEGISWHTAWMLFDSPLVKGQEFSTRAVRHKDWPMARECNVPVKRGGGVITVDRELSSGSQVDDLAPNPFIQRLHREWLEVFEDEVERWKVKLSDPDVRAAMGIGDKEPFRPALDRARWALPGSVATGACFSSDVRERARVVAEGLAFASEGPQNVWEDIRKGYEAALPGIAPFAMRKVGATPHLLPAHLVDMLSPTNPKPYLNDGYDGFHLEVTTVPLRRFDGLTTPYDRRQGQYRDPSDNRDRRVSLMFDCSLAVARDWHRHRTLYPWTIRVVVDNDLLQLADGYEILGDRSRVERLIAESSRLFRKFTDEGRYDMAALCLFFGAKVRLAASGGLRDTTYMLELRANAHGANFEYKAQAEELGRRLTKIVGA